MAYLILVLAIVLEIVATTALKASDSFTKPLPTVISLAGYVAAIYLLSVVMHTMPTGVVYAIWSGVGIVFISLVGYFYSKEALDFPAILGIGCIIFGVAVINLFSKTVVH